MKKSEIYYMAQLAVVDSHLGSRTKLEILRELIGKEDVAKFCEMEEEKANEAI